MSDKFSDDETAALERMLEKYGYIGVCRVIAKWYDTFKDGNDEHYDRVAYAMALALESASMEAS